MNYCVTKFYWLSNQTYINLLNDDRLDKNVNYIIVPMMNPEGYDFALATNQTWQKNMRKNADCDGVNLNFNFEYNFQVSESCDDEYSGEHAASAPETKAFTVWGVRLFSGIFCLNLWKKHRVNFEQLPRLYKSIPMECTGCCSNRQIRAAKSNEIWWIFEF